MISYKKVGRKKEWKGFIILLGVIGKVLVLWIGFLRLLGLVRMLAKGWLEKQSIYQIYLPPPKYIPRPNSSMSLHAKPNSIHQTDLLFLPRDVYRGKAYKYLLCVVDVASRYKGVYPLTSKSSAGVAKGFVSIYKNTPLNFQICWCVMPVKSFMVRFLRL